MNINGYNLEKDNMYLNKGKSRSIMYVNKNLKYSRQYSFEGKNDASIVIKIGLPHKPKFYIFGIYRQWSIPGEKLDLITYMNKKKDEKNH